MCGLQKMEFETKFCAQGSMEDNEETVKDSVLESLGVFSEPEVCNNGPCAVQNTDNIELFPEVNKKNEPEVCGSSPELEPEVLVSLFRKGYSLKKWRRIKRDVDKGDKMETRKLMESVVNSSKRMQDDDRPRKQKTKASVSSIDADVRSLDGFPLLADLGFGLGPSFAAGTDFQNRLDWSRMSSTAASTWKTKFDNNKMGSLGGKNLMQSAYDQQGKGQIQTSKKGRVEQGSYNGDYDKDLAPEELVADSSSEVKDERIDNHGSSEYQDSPVESFFAPQSTQEVLENELLKFKDINKDMSVDESVSDLNSEFIYADQVIQRTSSETNGDEETELEELFKQKIETEVDYLVISRTVQELRVATATQIFTVLKEQKALASERTQILDHMLRDAENKAAVLKTADKKLENPCEDAVSDETMILQNRVCIHGLCFLLQILLLVVIVTVSTQRTSQNYLEPPPT